MATKNPCLDVRQTRKNLGLTQTEFWSRFGVSQSGGSRYEEGNEIPQQVAMLIEIAYGTRGDQVIAELRG